MAATEPKGAAPKNQLALFEQAGNDDVLAALAVFFDSTKEELEERNRREDVVRVRHLIMYVLNQYGGMSFGAIGRLIGRRDHTTVIHGVNKVKQEVVEYPDLLDSLSGPIALATALKLRKQKVEEELKEMNVMLYAEAMVQIRLTKVKRQTLRERAIPERNMKVLEMYREGLTLQNISVMFDLSRERIRQIVMSTVQSLAINESISKGIVMDVDVLLEEEAKKRKNAQDSKKPPKPEKKIKEERWSRYYDACRSCGSTVYPHVRRGLCEQCAGQYRGKIREQIIAAHSNQCDVCHISRPDAMRTYGRDFYIQKDKSVLCRKCFLSDSGERMGHYKNHEWSRFYAACKNCGTTSVSHASRGLCLNCTPTLTPEQREQVIVSKGSKCSRCGISRADEQRLHKKDLRATKSKETLCFDCFQKYIREKR